MVFSRDEEPINQVLMDAPTYTKLRNAGSRFQTRRPKRVPPSDAVYHFCSRECREVEATTNLYVAQEEDFPTSPNWCLPEYSLWSKAAVMLVDFAK